MELGTKICTFDVEGKNTQGAVGHSSLEELGRQIPRELKELGAELNLEAKGNASK